MIQITTQSFDSEILQSQLPALVLWGSLSDANSNKIALEMMKLDPAKVKVGRVEVDACPDLSMKFNIRNLPYVMLFIGGMVMAEATQLSADILSQVK